MAPHAMQTTKPQEQYGGGKRVHCLTGTSAIIFADTLTPHTRPTACSCSMKNSSAAVAVDSQTVIPWLNSVIACFFNHA